MTYTEEVGQNLGYKRGKEEKDTGLDLISYPEILTGKKLLFSLQELCTESKGAQEKYIKETQKIEILGKNSIHWFPKYTLRKHCSLFGDNSKYLTSKGNTYIVGNCFSVFH